MTSSTTKAAVLSFRTAPGRNCTASQLHHFGSGEHSNLLKNWISRAKQDTEMEWGLALEEQDWAQATGKGKRKRIISVFSTLN